ncbi:hypothetical protein CC79DRAFT_1339522 [Sarocladium strictum]
MATLALAVDKNEKRGLCFVPNPDHPGDNDLWAGPDSDISWYYNYQDVPSPAFSDYSQEDFEFVPMMWGVTEDLKATTFLDNVKELIDNGRNISHVLGFNEPDAPFDWGGSNIPPKDAAQAWVVNFEPLGEMGVKLGLPGCTGGWGSMPWLREFLGNCSEILSDGEDTKKNCTFDFVPVHWYDNFEGLASHMGERLAEWPNTSIWITEYALAHKDLEAAQEFFNTTLEYFDKEDFVGKYTYFGAFRSDSSNVGTETVFLNNAGDLTDMGSWYLGGNATGVDPESAASRGMVTTWALVVGVAMTILRVL